MKTILCLFAISIALTGAVSAGQAVTAQSTPDSAQARKAAVAVDSIGATRVAPSATSQEVVEDSTFDDADSGTLAAPSGDSTKSAQDLMYRSEAQSMRRDVPVAPPAPPDKDGIARKKHDESQSMSPPPQMPRKDSYLVIPGKGNTPSGGRPQLNKRGVFLIIGACALVGGGVALYVLKSSKDKGAAEINNRIPPPPDPPAGGIFSNCARF